MSAEDGAWPEGHALRVLDEAGSTMAEAARLRRELTGPTWILALRQTAGKGRRGRAWATLPGNLAVTLAMPVTGGPRQAALRSFVAVLALADALGGATGRADAIALKWPNDVLLNGGKVAGILLETLPGDWLAIGFGVNLAAAPGAVEVENAGFRPVSVAAETGIDVAPRAFLPWLARAFAVREDEFRRTGFAPVRAAWLSRAARLGHEIVARAGNTVHHGRFETVDDTGCLVITGPDGRRAIPAAEVYFEGDAGASLH